LFYKFFFYLEFAGALHIISIKKGESICYNNRWPHKEHNGLHFNIHKERLDHGAYSYAASSSSPLATASIQRSASALMICSSSPIDVVAFLKQRALRSFHTHETSAKSESIPFCCAPVLNALSRRHQDRVDGAPFDSCFPNAWRTWNKTSLVNEHLAKMWSIDSGSWSQRKQRPLASGPCRAVWSAVQCRRRKASQGKIFTRNGAQAFQISLWPRKGTAPPCIML